MKLNHIFLTALIIVLTVQASLAAEAKSSWSFQSLLNNWQRFTTHLQNEQSEHEQNRLQVEACRDYAPGETRLHQSPLSSYLISHLGDGVYLASLNLHFVAVDVSVAQIADLRRQITTCYSEAGSLVDPAGERLSLQLMTEESSRAESFPATQISVHRTLHRDDALNYSIDMDCPTILHESLHLLGLWDEYEETEAHMPCRALGDSIMANQIGVDIKGLEKVDRSVARPEQPAYFPDHQAYFTSHAQMRFRPVLGLSCAKKETSKDGFSYAYNTTSNEMELFAFLPGKGVVYDRVSSLFIPDSSDFQSGHQFAPPDDWIAGFMQIDPALWRCNVTVVDTSSTVLKTGAEIAALGKSGLVPSGNPPLRAAHFRKILSPDCREKNKTYDLCTSEDYLVPPPNHVCVTQKYPVCRGTNWLN